MFYLGLNLENNRLKAAAICIKKKRIFLEDFFDIHLGEKDVKPFYNSASKYLNEKCVVASGMPADQTLLREKDLAISSAKHIKSALPFQIEELVPYDVKDALLSVNLIPQTKAITTLQLLATRKNDAKQKLETIKEKGFEVDFLGNEYSALNQVANFLHPPHTLKAIFYITEEKLLFVISSGNQCHLCYNSFFEENIYGVEKGQFFIKQLNRQLARLHAYIEEKKNYSLKELSLCVFAKNAMLQKLVAESFGLPLSSKKEEEIKLYEYALPIGFALQASTKQNNFLIREFVSEKLINQRQKKFLHSLCSIGIAFALLFSGKHLYSYLKEKELSQRLSALNHTTYNKFDIDEIDQEILAAQKRIKKEKEEFTYLFTYPSVSDALAWLSTHPVLNKIDEKTTQRADVHRIHYQIMEKEDKISGVNLEVSIDFPNQNALKDFEKSLEKDAFVDRTKPLEIKKEGISASFIIPLQNQVKGEL